MQPAIVSRLIVSAIAIMAAVLPALFAAWPRSPKASISASCFWPFRAMQSVAAEAAAAGMVGGGAVSATAAGTGADITGAQANLSIKENALARQQALLKQGFTTRADYEDALNEVKTAEQQLADARARAANAHAAIAPGEQPSIAQAQAARSVCRSPRSPRRTATRC